MNKQLSGLLLLLLVAGLAMPRDARSGDGGATIKVTLQQKPLAGNLSSRYLGTDPGKCLAAIPFAGTFSTGVPQDVSYWFVHSDGTKSAALWTSAPTQAGKGFTYAWNKYLPPNQPFAGWVRAEATWQNHPYVYKSANIPFTVTCIPVKPSSWPSAPIIQAPAENQKVAGGSLVVLPMNPGLSKCADGGTFFLKMEHRASPTADWLPGSMMKPLPCVPAGSKKSIAGMVPALYRIRAQESNGTYGFSSEWSAWRQFEVVK